MKKKVIYCERCALEIKDRDELVVSTHLFHVVPYHDECFSKSLKGWQTIILSNTPINGTVGNMKAIIAIIAFMLLIFLTEGSYILIALILLIIPVLRVFSWLAYERYLR